MKKADLNLLVIFDAIMREGSMTRAAQQLATTQPAVSNAVARMRLTWGDPLFIKQGRGIEPTPYAQTMWRQARAHLDYLREMVNPEPFDSAAAKRVFRIGTADLNAGLLWRGLRQHAEKCASGIGFHAVPNAHANTETQLVNAEIDLAITGSEGTWNQHIRAEPLLDSHFVCAMRPDHPLAVSPVSAEAYAAADHLMVSLTGDASSEVDTLLQARGLSRTVAMTVNHFALVGDLLCDSSLISTVPYEAVAEHISRGALIAQRPPLALPPITLSVVWHERSDRDAGHRWLRQQIQAVAQQTRQDLPTPACVCPHET